MSATAQPTGEGPRLVFRLLSGSLLIEADGRPVALASRLQHAVLTELVAADGAAISRSTLIDRIWPAVRPASADNLLSTHVARLRAWLDDFRLRPGSFIPRSTNGYRIDLTDGWSDLRELQRAHDQVRRGGRDRAEAYRVLERMRAPTSIDERLLEVVDGAWQLARKLVYELVQTQPSESEWAQLEAHLAAAHHRAPYDELVAAWWLRSLDASGRAGEGLDAYPGIVRKLRRELGISPGPTLRSAHAQLLASAGDEPPVVPPEQPDRPGKTRVLTPAGLPPPPAGFAGRTSALGWLVDQAHVAAPDHGCRLVVVSGGVGVGKSALAVTAANHLAELFPDGQVRIDLGATDETIDPAAAVTELLVGLGQDPATLPPGPGRCLDLLRSLTAHRSVLYVLDNAGPRDRIGDLIPNAPGSLVILTCRAAHQDAVGSPVLDLQPMNPTEALELLKTSLPGRDLTLGTRGMSELLRLCEGRPVALRVCARFLLAHPGWSVDRLRTRLVDDERRLDAFSDPAHGLTAVFARAAQDLGQPSLAALSATGLLGLAQVEPWMVAAVLDVDVESAQDGLDDLAEARLIDDTTVTDELPVFTVSSLIRAFAARRRSNEDAASTQVALRRYLQTLTAALVRRRDGGAATSVDADRLVEASVAVMPEIALVSAVELAARHGLAAECAELAQVLGQTVFADRNSFDAWRRTHEQAIGLAQQGGRRADEARLAIGLAQLHLAREEFDAAEVTLARATAVARAGEQPGLLAEVLLQRGVIRAERHRCRDGIQVLTQCLETTDLHPRVRAEALRQRSVCHRDIGRLDEAAADEQAAYALFVGVGDRIGEGLALRSRGLTLGAQGDWGAAEHVFLAAEDALRSVGARLMVQYAVQTVAKARLRQGSTSTGPALEMAREVFAELHDDFGHALVLRTMGEEARVRGDLDTALNQLHWSLKMWTSMRLPGWEARTMRDLARCLTAAGQHTDAGLMRVAALSRFDDLGLRESAELRAETPDP